MTVILVLLMFGIFIGIDYYRTRKAKARVARELEKHPASGGNAMSSVRS